MKSWLISGLVIFFSSGSSAAGYRVEKIVNRGGESVNLIAIDGMIEVAEWGAWRHATSLVDPGYDTLVTINSRGGTIPGGFMMIHHIEEFVAAQAERGRQVAVLVEGLCASMCVPVFFAFPQRYILPKAKIGLHGVSAGGLSHDEEQTEMYLQKMISLAEARNQADFVTWLKEKKRAAVFSTGELTYFSGTDLLKENSELISPQGVVENKQQIFSDSPKKESR